jgi:hypothetical protein
MTTAPAGTSGKATASLVCGIVSFLCCPIILSVLAIVLGNQAKNEIDANPALGGRGLAQAGIILGIISLVLGAIGIVVYALGIAAN